MKNQFVVGRIFSRVFIFVFVLLILNQGAFAQQYPDMKVILKNSATIEGEDGSLNESSVMMKVNGEPKTYPLSDVQIVMVKRGLGGKYALIAGGGCAALVLITIVVASGDENPEYDTGRLVGGGLIWVALFAGGGYLIGNAADDWNTIYMAPTQSSIIDKFKFGFGAARKGEFRVGLSYNF